MTSSDPQARTRLFERTCRIVGWLFAGSAFLLGGFGAFAVAAGSYAGLIGMIAVLFALYLAPLAAGMLRGGLGRKVAWALLAPFAGLALLSVGQGDGLDVIGVVMLVLTAVTFPGTWLTRPTVPAAAPSDEQGETAAD